jgi:hypothetical protein
MTSASQALRAEALDRTLVLMRDHVADSTADSRLLAELSRCRVVIVGDRANVSSRHGQVALVSTALLCARSGAHVLLAFDDAPLVGNHAPLTGTRLLEALVDVGADLIPGSTLEVVSASSVSDADLCVVLGDTARTSQTNAEMVVRICGDDWSGSLLPASETGVSWASVRAPFGAMSAAALVAGEGYKLVMRRLRDSTRIPIGVFNDTFAASLSATVRLAPVGTPCPVALGDLDFVSGGAVTHAALYALSRIEGFTATARVFEPQSYDLANLNRYELMRLSDAKRGKAEHLAQLDLSDIRIEPIARQYDQELQRTLGRLADNILVGVDHIPSRWLAQSNAPGWLGIAGTEHYETKVSFHHAGIPCAACLHYSDGGVDPRAPTAAFVSFWAGLWLAALCLRHAAGEKLSTSEQVIVTTMLRPDLRYAIAKMPIPRRSDCRLACGQTRT